MDNTKIKYSAWDSDFFGKNVGIISVENLDNLTDILEEAKNANYQLIYAFGNKDFFVDDEILKQFNGHLVDRKVIYAKTVEALKEPAIFASKYEGNELTAELEKLAYLSGYYSRFKLDNNFEENVFYRMYKIWIENSVKHLIADNVFIVKEGNAIKGMVTLKVDTEKGYIGLFAVSPKMQGKGYGKALINACETELLSKGISTLEVPTQSDNIQACKFYEKYGFKIKNIKNIYHFWL